MNYNTDKLLEIAADVLGFNLDRITPEQQKLFSQRVTESEADLIKKTHIDQPLCDWAALASFRVSECHEAAFWGYVDFLIKWIAPMFSNSSSAHKFFVVVGSHNSCGTEYPIVRMAYKNTVIVLKHNTYETIILVDSDRDLELSQVGSVFYGSKGTVFNLCDVPDKYCIEETYDINKSRFVTSVSADLDSLRKAMEIIKHAMDGYDGVS